MAATASRSFSDGTQASSPSMEERLQRLTTVRSDRHRVVTCYLKLEPRDRSRGNPTRIITRSYGAIREGASWPASIARGGARFW